MEVVIESGTPGRDHDVAIDVDPCTVASPTMRSVLDAAGLGCAARETVRVDGTDVAVDDPLDRANVVTGSTIAIDTGGVGAPDISEAALAILSGPSSGRCLPLRAGAVVLGRSRRAGVVVDDATVSGLHARVAVQGDGRCVVTDLRSTNGTRVNGQLLDRSAAVTEDDVLRFGTMHAALRSTASDDRCPLAPISPAGRIPFHRPPRQQVPPPPSPVTIPSHIGGTSVNPRFGWAAVVAPLVLGVAMALFFGPVMAAFALFSPVLVVGNWLEERRRVRAGKAEADAQWSAGLAALAADLDRAQATEAARRRAMAPDLPEVLRRACLPATTLWQRRAGDEDFGVVGVGIGAASWEPPLRESALDRHADVAAVVERASVLRDVPVAVKLAPGAVLGVTGVRHRALELARALVVQAAVHHGPADIGIAVFAAEGAVDDWEWAKWLPHVRAGGGQRLLATSSAAAAIVTDIERNAPALPLVLAVADGEEFVAGRRAPVRRLLEGTAQPACAIVVAATPDRLPSCCSVVIDVADTTPVCIGIDSVAGSDLTVAGLASDLARRSALWLARFEDPERTAVAASGLSSLSLSELMGVGTLDPDTIGARWKRASARSLSVPIGVGADGHVLLDLVADGPHALVSGATGSGKSELLRTLVCALAATFDPEHLVLVLVDFKGGSAFGGCASLPHTVGVVTDLDEQLGERVLRSLAAELRRRERLFRDAGVACIEDYVEGGHDRSQPLPRLVLVIDEFATLAAEVPQFVDALVGVAQRGRSLGVHLVLATQRPSGSVSPAVRANTSIRIALRVEDDGDSVDVIGCADAAHIDRRTPGKGFARFGPGAVVPFQAALAHQAAPSTKSALTVRPFAFGAQAPTARPDDGGDALSHLVGAIGAAARAENVRLTPAPWRPPLPTRVCLDELPDPGGDGCVIGLVDDPDNQRQYPFRWSPQTGNVLFYGTGGSGASTALRTTVQAMARRWTSSELYLYGLDFGTRSLSTLTELPHVGSMVGAADRERQQRLIRMLRRELERRRATAQSEPVPTIVLLIDNYGGFHAAFDDLAGLAWRDEVARIVADGPAVGIFTMASADRPGAVPLTIADLVSTKLLFRQADAGDVALFGLRPRKGPPLPVGRAIDATTGLEVQFALPPDDFVASPSTTGNRAPSVDVLPERVHLADVQSACGFDDGVWSVTVAVGDSDLLPYGFELGEGDALLVAGPSRSGRSTVLTNIATVVRAHAPTVRITAVAMRRSPLQSSVVDCLVTTNVELEVALDELGGARDAQLVLIDDAEIVDDPGGRLARLLSERCPHLRVVVAGRSDALRSAYGHWTSVVRRSRVGAVLRPHVDIDGELWQTTLPRRGPASFPVGRGYMLKDGGFELVQFAGPEVAAP